MNKFISFEYQTATAYFYTRQHLIYLLISLVIIFFFAMFAARQNLKFQKIFVWFFIFIITVLEVLRIIWNYYYLIYHQKNITFMNLTNLDFFTLALWISIPLFVIGTFLKKNGKHNILPLNFIFSVTCVIAIINMIYPLFLNSNFEFYHFYNIAVVLIRTLTIMLSLFFALAKWITINNFIDIWKSLISLLLFGILCISVYFIIGKEHNLFFIEYVPLFENLGIYLNFPFNFIYIGVFIFVLQLILFLPFYLYRKFKEKHG